MSVADELRAARDGLIGHQNDWAKARETFQWPRFEHFNFGHDWFDHLAASAERADQNALVIVEENGDRLSRTFKQLSEASNRVANWLSDPGGAAQSSGHPDARQPGGAVGGDAGGHQARCSAGVHHHADGRTRSPGPGDPGRGPLGHRRHLSRAEVCRRRRRLHPHPRAGSPCRSGGENSSSGVWSGRPLLRRRLRGIRRNPARWSRDGGGGDDAVLLHLRDHLFSRSWWSTPTPPTPWGTCPPCIGSVWNRGTRHLNVSSPGWAKHAVQLLRPVAGGGDDLSPQLHQF